MKINRTIKIEQDIKYLKACMGIRHWQDCDYSKDDGKTWIDACEEDTVEESENMKEITPCVIKKNIGYGDSDYWEIIIDLDNGKILDWPNNISIRTHYKVCDDGEYIFLDENKEEVVNITDKYDQYYVPDFLAIEDDGWGDYVYLNIDNQGNIEHFDIMKEKIEEYFDELND